MKFKSRFLFAALAGVLVLTSCAKEQTESYDKYESMALEAWMTQNHEELLDNYQNYGDAGYYIDILDAGDPQAAPVNDTICWVKLDFSARDLSGNIVLTRSAAQAKLAGTFTKYTHYVPYYRYCGTENVSGFQEGTFLALRNTQYLSETYYDKYKNDPVRRLTSREVLLREGAKVVLYMPSRVVGAGLSGTGGYEGQYSLASQRPAVITIEVCDTIKNPLEVEGSAADRFCELAANGGLQIYSQKEDSESPGIKLPTDLNDPKHPYNISQRWVSACDSVPQLYVNYRWMPGEKMTFPEPYAVGYEPYANASSLDALNQQIAEALKKRFYAGDSEEYVGVKALKADSVKMDGTARIWYITRLLDGFIVDTNIDEVRKIVYGEVKETGEYKRYVPSEGGEIQAYYYTIPHLKFGQWAAVLTTSTHAYGAQGVSGKTTTSGNSTNSGYGSGYSDYMNYMNYANSYYGNSYGGYYNNYYGGGYGGYGNGYYDPYYGNGYDYNYGYGSSGSESTTVKVTTINTEIPPFTPLVLEIYVEPQED